MCAPVNSSCLEPNGRSPFLNQQFKFPALVHARLSCPPLLSLVSAFPSQLVVDTQLRKIKVREITQNPSALLHWLQAFAQTGVRPVSGARLCRALRRGFSWSGLGSPQRGWAARPAPGTPPTALLAGALAPLLPVPRVRSRGPPGAPSVVPASRPLPSPRGPCSITSRRWG